MNISEWWREMHSLDQTGPHRSTAATSHGSPGPALLLQEVAHGLLLWPSQSRFHFHWTGTGRAWYRECM